MSWLDVGNGWRNLYVGQHCRRSGICINTKKRPENLNILQKYVNRNGIIINNMVHCGVSAKTIKTLKLLAVTIRQNGG